MHFARRLSKLEHRRALSRRPRIVIRLEGPGSEGLPQTQGPIDEGATVTVIHFVPTETAMAGDPILNGVETAGANP
jgi:hypothetical protein